MKKAFLVMLSFAGFLLFSLLPAREVRIMAGILVTSAAFTNGGIIPQKYTCDGDNVSPPLDFSQLPQGVKSLVLIADDPDAPSGDWVHWVLFNLTPDCKGLPEGFLAKQSPWKGVLSGRNDFGRLEYGGPCPPGGTHRYYFKLYALDSILNAKEGLTKKELLKLMEGRILAKGELMGKYSRK